MTFGEEAPINGRRPSRAASPFAPRHALVTGAAGAIGEEIARALARRFPAMHLTLVDVDPSARAIAASLHDAHAIAWDLAEPGALGAHHAALVEARGAVDVLVNCAGVMEVQTLAHTPWSVDERLLAIDLTSPMRLMSLTAPAMIAARAGLVINVSSMAGLTPIRGCAYYAAAKAGLAAASEIARLELADSGVRVVTVYPGPVRSALEKRARAQLPATWVSRMLPTGDARTLAARVLDACAHDRARVVYPALYDVASRFPTVAARFTAAWSPVPLQ